MDVTFEWDGLAPDELVGVFDALNDELQSELKSAATDIGVRIRGTAQRLAPVDEGRLESSLEHVVEQLAQHRLRVVVGTNVEYAPYQEFGTAVMDAQPYLRPALEEEKDWIVDRVETAVETAAQNAGFSV
ncbi:HK97-gp10 family putative phage morphogenesis protein [Natrinema pallidum]|uniref:HK97 gp10 family phage protein n=1 Tax=Natrinema pallidum TaxID=69527 RepID=A0A4P9TFH1_9EURY|nr:HK97-gp10 family putative phage morphogenesis protein [Natrinema pallidum]QCW03568.1 HK97 gp10 family phage protein [Natrinema pallidum]